MLKENTCYLKQIMQIEHSKKFELNKTGWNFDKMSSVFNRHYKKCFLTANNLFRPSSHCSLNNQWHSNNSRSSINSRSSNNNRSFSNNSTSNNSSHSSNSSFSNISRTFNTLRNSRLSTNSLTYNNNHFMSNNSSHTIFNNCRCFSNISISLCMIISRSKDG